MSDAVNPVLLEDHAEEHYGVEFGEDEEECEESSNYDRNAATDSLARTGADGMVALARAG